MLIFVAPLPRCSAKAYDIAMAKQFAPLLPGPDHGGPAARRRTRSRADRLRSFTMWTFPTPRAFWSKRLSAAKISSAIRGQPRAAKSVQPFGKGFERASTPGRFPGAFQQSGSITLFFVFYPFLDNLYQS